MDGNAAGQDVLTLDSGTVGIAHFAAGGLCRLYENMDTNNYFGFSEEQMCSQYASRDSGASSNDWWMNGFKEWVKSPGNKVIQDRVFGESRSGATRRAEEHGWTTDREMAIAVGVSNSFGNGGFNQRAEKQGWDPEKLLRWYGSQSNHKKRREDQINKWFPIDDQKILK